MVLIAVLLFIYLVGFAGFGKIALGELSAEERESKLMAGSVWVIALGWPVVLLWHLVKAASA